MPSHCVMPAPGPSLFTQVFPEQQGCVAEQGSYSRPHERSQKQPIPEASHGMTVVPSTSYAKQLSPPQQEVLPHSWEMPAHALAGGPQTCVVALQTSPAEQQATELEQLAPVAAHAAADRQVPEVWPAGMAHALPAQQSACAVQGPPSATQAEQLPSSQAPVQH